MTMFCPEEERLSAWIDRELAPVEDERISVHLGACETCRRAVTIAVLVHRESPETLSEEREQRLFQTIQGALAQPSLCVDDDRLAAWLHDGLAPEDRAATTEHLAECDDCRRAAALTRLSNAEPVSALSPQQEERALKLVLRSAGRDAFFSFWRVAAASILVAIASTYISIQWSGSPRPATLAAKEPGPGGSPGGLWSFPSGAPRNDPAATVRPTHASEASRRPDPPPEPPAEPSIIPARFQPVPVFEWEGLPSPNPGRLSYSDLLRSKDVAIVNVEGRAVVVMDGVAEARLAYAADAGAFVVEVVSGRVFVDTAGAEQCWEIRRRDRTVTLRSFRGRACADADSSGLRVSLLRGGAQIGPDRIDSGRAVDVQADSSVTVEDRKAACDTLEERYGIIRPRTLLVMRATAGKSCDEGPWRYVSPSREAHPLEEDGAVVPECPDPIRWVVFALDEPLKYASDMVLRASCDGTGTKIYLWAGGSGGWRREAARPLPGRGPEEWSLRGLRRDMVDLVAGEELRKIMIGVVQERGQTRTLEIDTIEIRRALD